ncbi:hypothetical protein C8R43DRAFT_1129468 [Mycena crocata]|nr:hypothetical protein C8R43DRAFT_1129468 [Mycena crocata]
MLCNACKHPLLSSDALPTVEQTHQLRELLRSGPIPVDTSHSDSQIATSTAALAEYDIHIQRLQETLRDLLADRLKLQEYVDGLRAVVSPARTLPPEILGEIFAPFSRSQKSSVSNQELSFLAKIELLALSKVCSRWHRVIMGTPRLWSDIAVDLNYWPSDPSEGNSFLNLLITSLERAAHHPLTLSLTIDNSLELEDAVAIATLQLLARYAQYWKHPSFRGHSSSLDNICHITGKLDILETLSLCTWEEKTSSNLFQIAPRLAKVSLQLENVQCCPKLPWDQLRTLAWVGLYMEDISDAIVSVQNLSHPEAAFELRWFDTDPVDVVQVLPAATSTISSFLVEVWPNSNMVLGEIFGCLTLPRLRKLCVLRDSRSKAFRATIPWPVNHFESLSSRSSFRNTLRVLEIPHVAITEDDLIRTLDGLESLERLIIGDQQEVHISDSPEDILITDSLLLRLARRPHLVPKLKAFTCRSSYKFSADVYFDFVVSRIAPGKELFQCGLVLFAATPREFDPDVHQKLLALVEKGELEFSIGEEDTEGYEKNCQ